jgi:hypothetical protein
MSRPTPRPVFPGTVPPASALRPGRHPAAGRGGLGASPEDRGPGLKVAAVRRPEAVRRAGNPASRMPPYRFKSLAHSSFDLVTSTITPLSVTPTLYMHASACPNSSPLGGEPAWRPGDRRGALCPVHIGAGLVWSCAVGHFRGRASSGRSAFSPTARCGRGYPSAGGSLRAVKGG